MLIDTHTHLYDPAFDPDREAVLSRALEAGLTRMYLPNIDSTTIGKLLELESQYPQSCFPMMGLHPTSVNQNVNQELRLIEHWLRDRTFAGIGETGLDFYWDNSYREEQLLSFRTQIGWARELGLPLSLHSRKATRECIEEIRPFQTGGLRGVFHCFGGTLDEAREIIDLGFSLGIGGVLTFRNSGLDKVLKELPLGSMLLETDSPYLAPVPFRGKRNESSYLPLIANKLAEVLQQSPDEISLQTSRNARIMFPE